MSPSIESARSTGAETMTQQEVFARAQELLTRASDYDTLDQSQVLNTLASLLALRYPDSMQKFHAAVTLCHRAIYFDLGADPLIEAWASWPARCSWLHLELDACRVAVLGENLDISKMASSNLDSSSAHCVPQDATEALHRYRNFYKDDGEGFPIDLWESYERSKNRRGLACIRSTLYHFATTIACADPESDLHLWSRALIVLTENLDRNTDRCAPWIQEANDSILRAPPEKRRELAVVLFRRCFEFLSIGTSAHTLEALRSMHTEKRSEFFEGCMVSVHRTLRELPGTFWDEMVTAQKSFQVHSPNYPFFAPDFAKELLESGTLEVTQIRMHGRFVAAGFLMHGARNFAERSRTRLAQFSRITLPAGDLHSWQYLSILDLESALRYRELRIDWPMFLNNVMADMCIANNRENILGIVEEDNPATKSHLRLGAEPLPSNQRFTSNGGKTSRVWRQRLLDGGS